MRVIENHAVSAITTVTFFIAKVYMASPFFFGNIIIRNDVTMSHQHVVHIKNKGFKRLVVLLDNLTAEII